jgi:hypothetical protein
VRDLGIVGDQVDFVFDRENELFDNANDLLRRTRRFFDPALFHMCGDAIQRDEDRVLPLQAADLIAGVAKDHCNDPQNMDLGGHLKTGQTWPLQNRPTKLSQNKSIYNPPMAVSANLFSQSVPKSLY